MMKATQKSVLQSKASLIAASGAKNNKSLLFCGPIRSLKIYNVANDANGEPRPGEGLAPDHSLWHTELDADLTDLVLKQQPKGLTELKVHIVG